ncbi:MULTISPECIES: hypothetical protein [unclassified Vibrio]|uniref:hypothetical protein n=1 Tax=unclassified Vibrio TaxID=2614977 RepID=UPI000C862456|nr:MULTISPECIES: hypothetical protein [unclassified Vibrio]PMK78374.1 hypothetical protein BCT92_05615 [Vibrio sp. 10N.261.52.E5]TKF80011.1 hypothetical protein FCV65_20750 [Vibrio sp. F13]
MLITSNLADFIITHDIQNFDVRGNTLIPNCIDFNDEPYATIKLEVEFHGDIGMLDGHYVLPDFPDLVKLLMGKNFRLSSHKQVFTPCLGKVDAENSVIKYETEHGIFTQEYTFREFEEEKC